MRATRLAFLTALCAAAAASAAASTLASVEVAADPRGGESLRVDAAGNAEVSWTAADGTQRSLLVARDGTLRYGQLSGPDVSRPAVISIPWAVVVRQTPDGSFYALQAWRRLDPGPVELRFSRWQGEPTRLTLTTVCCKWGHVNIVGTATFHGRPIYGYKSTPQGNPLDPYGRNVYLDSYRSGGWDRMMGILTHRPTGSFSLWIRPEWTGAGYRGTIPGPNWGWTLGPDAFAQTGSSSQANPPPPQMGPDLARGAGTALDTEATSRAHGATVNRASAVSTGNGTRSAVQVTLGHTPDPARVGRPLTYSATVTNLRPEASKNVTLYFMMTSLPADPVTHRTAAPTFVFATANGRRCTNADKIFVCALGSLPGRRSETATFVVVPTTSTFSSAQFAARVYTHVDGEAYSANSQVTQHTAVNT